MSNEHINFNENPISNMDFLDCCATKTASTLCRKDDWFNPRLKTASQLETLKMVLATSCMT